MTNDTADLFGSPHFELVSRYGYREITIARHQERAAIELVKREYLAIGQYPNLMIRSREF